MQPLPPQLELPEGDRFTLPTVSAVRELVPPGAQLPAHMVLKMICGKELWVPKIERSSGRWRTFLLPSVNDFGECFKLPFSESSRAACFAEMRIAPHRRAGVGYGS